MSGIAIIITIFYHFYFVIMDHYGYCVENEPFWGKLGKKVAAIPFGKRNSDLVEVTTKMERSRKIQDKF